MSPLWASLLLQKRGMKLYGISGLGADERVFKKVNEFLSEPIIYVPWIEPEPKETLSHYAKRLSTTIDTSESFALVGLSFGGMIVSEMNKHVRPERSVIISSAACMYELPGYFRGIGRLNLVPYIPERLLSLPVPLLDAVMNLKRQDSKELMHEMVHATDREFIKWAVQAILTWENEEIPKNLTRIHGSVDRVLPVKTDVDDLLEGGHLVIMDEYRRIAEAIQRSIPVS